jgi:hypothetical protein
VWSCLARLFVLRRVRFFLWLPLSPRRRALMVACHLGGGAGWLSPLVFGAFSGSPCVAHVPRAPGLVWRSFAAHVAGPLCGSPCPAAFRPLGLASLHRSPLTVLVEAPSQARGLCPPPELPLPSPFLQEGSVGRCSGWAALRLRGSLGFAGRCLLRPSPRSPLNVLVPNPPQGPGALPTPGAPPCVPPGGVRRPLLARVGTLCASAGRWDSLAAALVTHGCLPLRHLWLCLCPLPPLGVRSSLALSPLRRPYP